MPSSVPHGGSDQPTSVTPMTPAGEFPEMVSMGGESLGSLSEEFETVSFAEETGQQLYATCMIYDRSATLCCMHDI